MASAVQSVHGDGSPERTGRGSNNEYLRIAQLSISPREQIMIACYYLFTTPTTPRRDTTGCVDTTARVPAYSADTQLNFLYHFQQLVALDLDPKIGSPLMRGSGGSLGWHHLKFCNNFASRRRFGTAAQQPRKPRTTAPQHSNIPLSWVIFSTYGRFFCEV